MRTRRTTFGITPLSQACTNGSAALVELLLKAGANPEHADRHRRDAAHDVREQRQRRRRPHAAGSWRRREREGAVAEPDGVDVGRGGTSSGRGRSCSSRRGADLRAHTKKGFTALHFAAREGDLEIARRLLAAGVDMNIRSQPEPAERGRRERRADAAARGAAGSAHRRRVSAGSTPLLVATVRGHVPLALFLLEQGADPNVGDAGFTPLHWAAGTWEGGVSNPVYGFSDPMSGIPESPGQAAAREGAAGARRESERPHDAAAAGIRRRATTTRPARRRSCSPARLPMSR